VIIWLWEAGAAVGVTDDYQTACRSAAAVMRGTGANTAVVQGARLIYGAGSLDPGYEATSGSRWVARRQANGRIQWTLRPASPVRAAS
jgi:hypothetical protein